MSIQRKVRKLIRDPKRFFRDMHINFFKVRTPVKAITHNNNFIIIVSGSNTPRNIDFFFKSLAAQTLSFNNYIQVVLHNYEYDEKSMAVIQKWIKEYPESIQIVQNENSKSIRDFFSNSSEMGWLTFASIDDFYHKDYFQKIDSYISKEKNIQLISCKTELYNDEIDSLKELSLLKNQYKKNQRIKKNEFKNESIVNIYSTFFKLNLCGNMELNYPLNANAFNGYKFILDYLELKDCTDIYMTRDAKYISRTNQKIREEEKKIWQTNQYYSDLLSGCHFALESAYSEDKQIPVYLQNIVLYVLLPIFKKNLNNDKFVPFMDNEDKNFINTSLVSIFNYIAKEVIHNFNLGNILAREKTAFLGLYKNAEPVSYQVYVEKYDAREKEALFCFYIQKEQDLAFYIDGVEIIPNYFKIAKIEFFNNVFLNEYRVWLPLGHKQNKLEIRFSNRKTIFICAGKSYKNSIALHEIMGLEDIDLRSKSNIWLFADRELQADDNAEHLYRYVMQKYPTQKCFFALRPESHDWERLSKEGFLLVAYDSEQFRKIMSTCSLVISSHLGIGQHFGRDTMKGKQFIFLQHGVLHNEHALLFNDRKYISKFVTTTQAEYDDLVGNYTRYNLTKKEVVLTGLARHDSLLNGNQENTKTILIMPTWRRNIVGKVKGNGHVIEKNPDFITTTYAQHWQSLLQSPVLKKLIEEYEYKVIYAPHFVIEQYLEEINVPTYIDVWAESQRESMQSLFQKSTLMITDYSSVAFDMAYLNKPILYYQFDLEDFYTHYQRGYFDYKKHGFGPVADNEYSLLEELKLLLINKGMSSDKYQRRVETTFAARDGRNCEKLYQVLLEADSNLVSTSSSNVKSEVIEMMLDSSNTFSNHRAIQQRSRMLMTYGCGRQYDKAFTLLADSLLVTDRLGTLNKELECYRGNITDTYLRPKAYFYYALDQWSKSIGVFEEISSPTLADYVMKLECLAWLSDTEKVKEIGFELQNQFMISQHVLNCWILVSEKKWDSLIKSIINYLDKHDGSINEFDLNILYKLLAIGYLETNQPILLGKILPILNANKNIRLLYKKIVIRKEFMVGNYQKAIDRIDANFQAQMKCIPNSLLYIYLRSLAEMSNFVKLKEALQLYYDRDLYDNSIELIKVKYMYYKKQWHKMLNAIDLMNDEDQIAFSWERFEGYRKIGEVNKAYSLSLSLVDNVKLDNKQLEALGDVCLFEKDWIRAEYFYKNILNTCDKSEVWDKLKHTQLMGAIVFESTDKPIVNNDYQLFTPHKRKEIYVNSL